MTATNLHGWDAVLLSNELISVIAVPDIGGRVMSLKLGPREFLFSNPALAGHTYTAEEHRGDGTLASWKNYGGEKTWPAPQGWGGPGEWPGPPDPVLDTGPYQATLSRDDESVQLTMVSLPDPSTGLRIHRHLVVRPATTRLVVEQTLENIADRPVRWALWDVAQLDCARRSADGGQEPDSTCWLYIPFEAGVGGEHPYRVMFGEDHPQWRHLVAPGLLGVQYRGVVGKIGLKNTAGWLAFASQMDGYVCCAQFSVDPNLEYPDDGATVECWTEAPGVVPSGLAYHSVGYLMEAEVLGPLRSLQPGERSTLRVEWAVARCDGPIVRVDRGGCSHVPLSIVVEEGWARVQGEFGCFHVGQVELVWLDAAERELERDPLQNASPLSILVLDHVVRVPNRAARARLEIRPVASGIRSRLDEAVISFPHSA